MDYYKYLRTNNTICIIVYIFVCFVSLHDKRLVKDAAHMCTERKIKHFKKDAKQRFCFYVLVCLLPPSSVYVAVPFAAVQ